MNWNLFHIVVWWQNITELTKGYSWSSFTLHSSLLEHGCIWWRPVASITACLWYMAYVAYASHCISPRRSSSDGQLGKQGPASEEWGTRSQHWSSLAVLKTWWSSGALLASGAHPALLPDPHLTQGQLSWVTIRVGVSLHCTRAFWGADVKHAEPRAAHQLNLLGLEPRKFFYNLHHRLEVCPNLRIAVSCFLTGDSHKMTTKEKRILVNLDFTC